MKISDLHIENFGGWSGLHLHSLTDGLSVSYSPEGLDTTAIVHFVRAMLYGFDDKYRQSLAPIPGAGWGGSIGVNVGHARETIRRHDDGTVYGRFNVDGANGTVSIGHPRHLLGDVSLTTYSHAFAFDFQHRPSIEGLVASVVQYEEVVQDAELSQRTVQLRSTLSRQRERLAQLPQVETPLATLKLQRDALKAEIESLRESFERDRTNWRVREEELDQQIDRCRKQLGELRIRLQDNEYAIESRIATCREAAKRALAEKRETLAQLDGQLTKWTSVLTEMQQQRDRLQSEVSSRAAKTAMHAAATADPLDHLGSLEAKIKDLATLVNGLTHQEEIDDESWSHLRNTVIPSLNSMRDDVFGLCRALSRGHVSIHHNECVQHLNQLTRCQSELRITVENMTGRRKLLLSELAQLNRQVSSIGSGYEDWRRYVDVDANLLGDVGPRSYERSVVDMELHRLLSQRNDCEREINTVTAKLANLEDQRGCLPDWRNSDLQNQRLSEKQLELDRTFQMIRDGRERIEVANRIAAIELELRNVELSCRQESIFEGASGLVRHLTRGQCQSVALRSPGSLAVRNGDGVWTDYHHLDEATRDQVYLSLALAVASAIARGGTHLPVVLSDVCLRCNHDWVEATVEVLQQFALNGHQVILFTGQPSLVDSFRTRNIPVNELPPSSARQYTQHDYLSRSGLDTHHGAQPRAGTEFQHSTRERVSIPTTNGNGSRLAHWTNGREKTHQSNSDSARYYLHESNPVDDAPSIDAQAAHHLRSVGVHRVGDLLRVVPTDLSTRLAHVGITSQKLRQWQAEALLVCRVPNLHLYDARILVACGVTDPEILRMTRPAELHERVTLLAKKADGQALLDSGSKYEIERLAKWIENSARHELPVASKSAA